MTFDEIGSEDFRVAVVAGVVAFDVVRRPPPAGVDEERRRALIRVSAYRIRAGRMARRKGRPEAEQMDPERMRARRSMDFAERAAEVEALRTRQAAGMNARKETGE